MQKRPKRVEKAVSQRKTTLNLQKRLTSSNSQKCLSQVINETDIFKPRISRISNLHLFAEKLLSPQRVEFGKWLRASRSNSRLFSSFVSAALN
jgi:hypothetical protein